MQSITVEFFDGDRRVLCHDGTGGVFDGGYVVGLANDADDLASGGTGELYTWGPFRVVASATCGGNCDACGAG